MDAAVSTKSGKEVPVNNADPTALLLEEACAHLRHNRLIRALTGPVGLILLALLLGLSFTLSPVASMGYTVGVAAGYLVPLCLYLWWYGRFVDANRSRAVRCPHCTSRMWQFCCSRCSEPVPPLVVFARGLFMSHCPHCGLRLSARKGTLLALCSTCSKSYERPDLFYSKPTYAIVWLRRSIPRELKDGWRPVTGGRELGRLYHHEGTDHSANFLCFVKEHVEDSTPIVEHLVEQTRLLLIDSDVPPEIRNLIGQAFGKNTIKERISKKGGSAS